ncbi:MAG: helix-turn-helix domain-containing protein [Chthoniobacterales bacterium]
MPDSSNILAKDPLLESIPQARREGLNFESFRKDCVDFHWHFHPEIELVYIRRGRGVRYIGRSMEPYFPGDFCLIGSNIPHAFGSDPTERKGAAWIVGQFLPSIWGEAFWKLPETRRISDMLQRAERGIHFEGADSEDCIKAFAAIEKIPPGAARLAAWIELLDRLTQHPAQRDLNVSAHTATTVDFRLQKLLAWIEEHAADTGLTQTTAAETVRLSPQAFCRFFRSRTGRPFHRYLSEVRVTRACSRLLHSDARISEIAFESGFNNLANFNRRFREITGRTPRNYRRMHGGVPMDAFE